MKTHGLSKRNVGNLFNYFVYLSLSPKTVHFSRSLSTKMLANGTQDYSSWTKEELIEKIKCLENMNIANRSRQYVFF